MKRSRRRTGVLCLLVLCIAPFLLMIYRHRFTFATTTYSLLLDKLNIILAAQSSLLQHSLDSLPEGGRDVAPSTTTGLNIVDILQTSSNASGDLTFPCVAAHIDNLRLPICLYTTAEDIWVSGKFHNKGYWERENVITVLKFLHTDASLGFLDIGANVGSYNQPVAAMNRSVVVVEPNWETTRRLATSARLGGIVDHFVLLHNAVSDSRGLIKLGTSTNNRGNTFMPDCANVSGAGAGRISCSRDAVKTILLDDLSDMIPSRRAIIKIDIQCAELQALNSTTSIRFLTTNHVPMIFMEWQCYRSKSLLRPVEDVEQFIVYMTSMNYTAHEIGTGRPLTTNQWRSLNDVEVMLLKK